MKFLRKLFGLCNHDYKYHKIRYVQNIPNKNFKDIEDLYEDYTIEFYQCAKCGHIHFIHMKDNLKHSTCS